MALGALVRSLVTLNDLSRYFGYVQYGVESGGLG
jgi:hypothetical protein